MKRICVFAASRDGANPIYKEAAAELGRVLAQRGYEIVYGGSSAGLMGSVADQVLQMEGKAIGVMPTHLVKRETAHRSLSEFYEVENMHERKAMMGNLADAFVCLPGGLGTFEELFEVACWATIGLHKKPIGLVNTNGFYDGLLAFLEHTAQEGFMNKESLAMFIIEEDVNKLIDRLEQSEKDRMLS